jgi:hypothetical protein
MHCLSLFPKQEQVAMYTCDMESCVYLWARHTAFSINQIA